MFFLIEKVLSWMYPHEDQKTAGELKLEDDRKRRMETIRYWDNHIRRREKELGMAFDDD